MNYVGHGVAWALNSVTTPTIVDEEGADRLAELVAAGGGPMVEAMMLEMERHALAGPSDEDAVILRDERWDPEAAWRNAEERAAEKHNQAGILDLAAGAEPTNEAERAAVTGSGLRDWLKGTAAQSTLRARVDAWHLRR